MHTYCFKQQTAIIKKTSINLNLRLLTLIFKLTFFFFEFSEPYIKFPKPHLNVLSDIFCYPISLSLKESTIENRELIIHFSLLRYLSFRILQYQIS